MSRRVARIGGIIVLTLAALSRLAVMIPAARRPPDDPDNYLPLARALAAGQGLSFKGKPTAYRPPLYPIALAPLVGAFGPEPTRAVLVFHLALGVGTAGLTFAAARRWGMGEALSLVAGLVVALDPVLVVQARSVMTETLAAFLLAGTLWALGLGGRCAAWLGGLGFGLQALCRPSLLPGAAFVVLARLLIGEEGRRERLARAAILATATLGTLIPWAARNARLFGEPVWTTTHGGYTLGLANNPIYYDEVVNGPPGAVWEGANQVRWWHNNNVVTTGMPEPQADRVLRDTALRTIRERPRDFLRATLARLGRFWGIAPAGAVYPGSLRLAVAAWTVPLWIAVGAGLLRKGTWGWPRVAAPAVVLGLACVHALYWTDLRMRAPIVPALALIAASSSEKRRGASP